MSGNEVLALAENNALLEVGRKAIEDVLLEWRDCRISTPFRGNGLVCREKDGKESSIIRMGPEDGLRIGLRAIAAEIERLQPKQES